MVDQEKKKFSRSNIQQQLTARQSQMVPSEMNSNRNLTQESPLFEKVARTRFDPAHAMKYAKGPSATSRTYTESAKTAFNITTVANVGAWVASIPSFEVPYIVSLDNGITWYGRWANTTDVPYNRINEVSAEAIRTIGKSMTIRNVTTALNYVPVIKAMRMDPAFNYTNRADTQFVGTAAATNIDITSVNAVAARTISVNRKVIQNVPQTYNEVTDLATAWKDSCYLVNEIDDYQFRRYECSSDFAGINDGVAPTTTQENGVLRLGFIGGAAKDGTSYVLNDNAFDNSIVQGAHLVSSKFLNTDITAFYIPANATVQTFELECYEHTQIITSDPEVLSRSYIDDPYQSGLESYLARTGVKLSGMYPGQFNDWGTIWSYLKRAGSKVADAGTKVFDFYKTNSKLLKPVVSLLPGGGLISEAVDKFM